VIGTSRARAICVASLLGSAPALGAQDGAPLARAVARVGAMDGVRTVHVWRGEELLAARAFRGAGFGPHDVKSVAKSVLSALVGIALDRGLLPGLDAPLVELLPEAAARLDDPRKLEIRLRHLLAMTPGLASTSGPAYGAWVRTRDWVRAALARPLAHPPGERFVYSTGSSHLVAAALARHCGCDLLAWGREALFAPLGMEIADWARDPSGIRFGGNSLALAPESLGRLGQLYLARGEWRGRRLLAEEWIERSTARHAEGWPERYGAYGLLWWLAPFAAERAFFAAGFGGQFLLVAPEREAVVVITSTPVGKGAAWDRELLGRIERELLPAVALRSSAHERAGANPTR
jgi:CubicO group peptidase (beta-lactamase class C family)